MNSANIRLRNDRHWVIVAVSLSLLACFSLVSAGAQSRSQKRITSVWTATSAEGSRVHVDSDSPVTDYEAYTRGNHFYVKIPLSDLPSARGSLLGRGFEEVQIQRYGSGIIISFRLRPGTVARVEQLSSRLEVVFSTPLRYQNVSGRSTNPEAANRNAAKRIADSGKSVQPRPTEGSSSGITNPSASSAASASPSASALNTPSAVATPTAPPAAFASTPVASGDSDWARRKHYWKAWAELNWLRVLIGDLIALVILVLLVSRFGAKRRRGREIDSEPEPTVRREGPGVTVATQTSPPPMANAAVVAGAATAYSPRGQTMTPTNSSQLSPTQEQKDAGEDQEREVFEL